MNVHGLPEPDKTTNLTNQPLSHESASNQQSTGGQSGAELQLRPPLPKLLLGVVALMIGIILVIIISGLAGEVKVGVGRDPSASDNNSALRAAVAGITLPTETTTAGSPTSTSTSSMSTETVEPDVTATETEIPINTPRPSSTSEATITRIPTAVLTSIAATQIAHATNVVVHWKTLQTTVALTHAPTITPGRPVPQPSPTLIMGMLPGCGNISSEGPQAYSCWRGIIDGHVVEVYTGKEGSEGDAMQGLLWVHVRGQGQQGVDIYDTPQRVGAVRITAVNGLRFTLQSEGQATPQVFMFDLGTRQWVSP